MADTRFNLDGSVCCGDAAWRGRLCQYHQGLEDADPEEWIKANPETALRILIDEGSVWCANCDGRRCMDCVLRTMHGKCKDDCPDCCRTPDSGLVLTYPPALHSMLKQGWDKEGDDG